jgi:3-oxoacyl-[acyl-carrier protein] reductase
MEINNSTVLITGGSSGIGKETAKQFIARGAKVVITGRNEKKLKRVAEDIGAIPLLFDISDLKSIVQKAKDALFLLEGKIDTLINNAGIGAFPALGEITKRLQH